jgi:hypothetical protein
METPRVNSSQDETRPSDGEFFEWVRERAGEPMRVRLSFETDVRLPIEIFVDGPQNYGFVGPCMLPISEALESELVDHLRWWQENVNPLDDGEDDGDEDSRAWALDGRRLRERLQAELGPQFLVEEM